VAVAIAQHSTCWWGEYVGLPFVDGGRGDGGVDCWGLVRLVYARELDVKLPGYGEISASELRALSAMMVAGAWSDPAWHPIDAPRAFDVAVMTFYGRRSVGHVGVMIDGAAVLHIERQLNAAVVPLSHWTIRNRVKCFRRHMSQTASP